MSIDDQRENGTAIENYADLIATWGMPDMRTQKTINGISYIALPKDYLNPGTTADAGAAQDARNQLLPALQASVIKDPETGADMIPFDMYNQEQQLMAPYSRQKSGLSNFLTGIMDNGPLIMGGAVAGAGMFGGLESLIGTAGGGGAPGMGVAAGGGGASMSAADILGLQQMGQAAGLTGDALAQFVAQGGASSIGIGAGATIPEWLKPFMPTPGSVATSAATQLLNSGDGGNPFEGATADGGTSSGIWDMLKNAPIGSLATLAGGLGGYLSGKSPNEAQSSTDVPAWLKPYYSMGLDAGLQQLGQSKDLTPEEKATIARMQQGLSSPNAGLEAANKTITDTASGKYLDLANNPQWQEAARQIGTNYNETIRPGTDAAFSRAGAMGVGNSAWEEMTARNNRSLATGLGTAGAGIYGQERQNQLNASSNMPAFQSQYLTGLGNQSLQLGNYQRTQPWQGILNYGQLLGSLKGPSVTTQQASANPWQTAAGGAMAGYGLSNLWSNSNTSTPKTLASLWG